MLTPKKKMTTKKLTMKDVQSSTLKRAKPPTGHNSTLKLTTVDNSLTGSSYSLSALSRAQDEPKLSVAPAE